MSPNKNFKIKDHLLPLPSPKLHKVWNMSLEIATEVKGVPASNYVQMLSWPSAESLAECLFVPKIVDKVASDEEPG